MIRAILVEDNIQSRTALYDDLKEYCPSVEVEGQCGSVKEALAMIPAIKPDVVFLDVDLEDGTGFDILKQIKDPGFHIIFTTGSDDHAMKAIKFSALDYLLKPVDPDDLILAVKKLQSAKKEKHPAKENLDLFLENMRNANKAPKRIALSTSDRIHIVPVNEIIRCESVRNYTLFHLANNKQVLVTRTLKEYDEMLEDSGFVRVHNSHLININCLKEFVKTDGGYALMSDGSKVPVAVRKKDDLLRYMGLE